MNIVLINPPHTAIGSRVPDDHLPPLGLLAIGGPLLDSGHQVRLVDAEFGPMPLPTLVEQALGYRTRDHALRRMNSRSCVSPTMKSYSPTLLQP